MFENQVFNTILQRMLSTVPNSRDKREGSIIYDATAPAAIEFELLYYQLDWYIKQSFGDTADRPYLIRLALERGLAPYEATYAIVKGQFTPSSLDLAIDTRFSLGIINYTIIEKIEDGIYLLRCETAGTVGNNIAGQLLPISFIQGLETAQLIEVTVPGEDEEDTEAFRKRYLTSFDSNAYGGNIADYKEKVNKMQGVGGVKVYPIWQGGGSVRIVFMTSEYKPPTVEFIDQVQTAIDPVTNQGLGLGVAPIGHTVTVQGAQNSNIDIGLTITYQAGFDFNTLKEAIEQIIDNYFLELNQDWQNTQIATTEIYSNTGIVVRVAQIESRLLNISGIEDIEDTKLNGLASNLTLGVDELAVRGAVSG